MKKEPTTIVLDRVTDKADPELFKAVFGVSPKAFLKAAWDDFDGIKPIAWHRYCDGWIGSRARAHEAPCPNCGMPPEVEAYELAQRLLEFGGTHVNLPAEIIPYAGAFALYGALQVYPAIEFVTGKPNMCHVNVCKLHRSDTDGNMVTGFALAHDGTWYLHSWWQRADGTILETTIEPFHVYFGIALTSAGADAYCERRVGPAKSPRAQPKSSKAKTSKAKKRR